MSFTEGNYKIAVDLLQERFAQKQIIVNAHMEALLKLNSVSAMADIKKIRQIHDQVEIHVRGLQAQGVDSVQYGTLLIPIMMAKIPEDLRLILSRQFSGENWNLDELLKALKTELEARERCASSSVGISSRSTQVNPPLPRWKGEEAEGNPTAAALASFNRRITCTYCHNSHPSVQFNVVNDVKARKSLPLKQGRCFICLKKKKHTSHAIVRAPRDVLNARGEITTQVFVNRSPLCSVIHANRKLEMQITIPRYLPMVTRTLRCLLTQQRQFYFKQPRFSFQGQMTRATAFKLGLFLTLEVNAHT